MSIKLSKTIDFIYFDVGGVAIIDFSGTNKWTEMFVDLGVSQKQIPEVKGYFNTFADEICTGGDINNFIIQASDRFGIRFPEGYDMTKDFVNRFEKNESMYNLIIKLSKDYKVGLLTGMYPGMLDMIFRKGLLPDIKWDAIVDSSVEGFTKPNEEIYKIAEEKAGVDSTNILFIDNSQTNLDTANKRDWQTFLYDPTNTKDSTDKLLKYLGKI